MSGSRSLLRLPKAGRYGAILADPPWPFQTYSGAKVPARSSAQPYAPMPFEKIAALPVGDIAGENCVLFLWVTWPTIERALKIVRAWGFTYKTCAFNWMKADVSQLDLFRDDADADMMLGHWTRSNGEACLLATRGKPKRLDAGVRMGIIERAREHSRKPDCVHERIERLVAGPYVELFARARRRGWDAWGNETRKFGRAA